MNFELLLISRYVSYAGVPHAGGKSSFYYGSRLTQESGINVRWISIAADSVERGLVESRPENRQEVLLEKRSFFSRLTRGLPTKYNPWSQWGWYFSYPYYRKELLKRLRSLAKSGYQPNIILLEWIHVGFLISQVKRIFPRAKIIIGEVDVYFNSISNGLDSFEGFESFIRRMQFARQKRAELKALSAADAVWTVSQTEKSTLEKEGVDGRKIFMLSLFYEPFIEHWKPPRSKILGFFGYMARRENSESVKWFVDRVLPRLIEIDQNIRLEVVGGGVPEFLKKRESKNLKFWGYLEHPREIFRNFECFVVPLVAGGGVKVKVLEGLASGVPIISNQLGVDGLDVIDGKHFLFADTAEKYVASIVRVLSDTIFAEQLASQGRDWVHQYYSFEKSYGDLLRVMSSLLEDQSGG